MPSPDYDATTLKYLRDKYENVPGPAGTRTWNETVMNGFLERTQTNPAI
jgi:hypothetical protein